MSLPAVHRNEGSSSNDNHHRVPSTATNDAVSTTGLSISPVVDANKYNNKNDNSSKNDKYSNLPDSSNNKHSHQKNSNYEFTIWDDNNSSSSPPSPVVVKSPTVACAKGGNWNVENCIGGNENNNNGVVPDTPTKRDAKSRGVLSPSKLPAGGKSDGSSNNNIRRLGG